jgi:hypothetical protein
MSELDEDIESFGLDRSLLMQDDGTYFHRFIALSALPVTFFLHWMSQDFIGDVFFREISSEMLCSDIWRYL